jgi:hypothetical protein
MSDQPPIVHYDVDLLFTSGERQTLSFQTPQDEVHEDDQTYRVVLRHSDTDREEYTIDRRQIALWHTVIRTEEPT